MQEKTRMIMFVSLVVIIYGLLNYYVLFGIIDVLGHARHAWHYELLIFLTFSFIAAMLFEKQMPNKITRSFYILASLWMGTLFISFWVLLLFDVLDLVFPITQAFIARSALPIILVLSIYATINGNIIKIKKIFLTYKGTKYAGKNLRVVQLSDLHLGTVHQERFLTRTVGKVNALNPDIVVITGDLVDGSAPLNKTMIAPLNAIRAPIFYVIGNHEIYEGLDAVLALLKKTKITVLRNQSVRWKQVALTGIDYAEEKDHLQTVLARMKFNPLHFNILLYHAPMVKVDFLASKGIHLFLSGHTHHGQIWPFNYFELFVFPYIKGMHRSRDKTSIAYVAPGTGTWGPPMRLGSDCEITVFDIDFENRLDKFK